MARAHGRTGARGPVGSGRAAAAARPRAGRVAVRCAATALATALAAAALGACTSAPDRATGPARTTAHRTSLPASCPVSSLLVPACGAWWGAAVEPAGRQSQVDAVKAFERRIGRPVPIVHLYHRGGDLFPTQAERALVDDPSTPRVLFFNWRPEGALTWSEVAAGGADDRIDRLARRLRATLHEPFFLSIDAEPEDEVVPSAGSGRTAADYRQMFRHVVQRLRNDGVRGAVTVMDYIATANWVAKPWFAALYPGNDVVDWLAVDTYLRQSEGVTADFAALVHGSRHSVPGWPGFLAWAAAVAPGKPVMLGEWGAITDRAHEQLKVDLLREFAATAPELPQIKAYVYWSSARQLPVNGGSGTGDTRIDASERTIEAFVDAVREPWFSRVRLPR
ncbi:MAG: glycosyl hydrolase [Frankiaceae bacterium]